MSCKISKNRFGKIIAVNNQQGEKSTLFQQILNVPSIALNDAIEMYKGIYSDKLKGKVQFQIIGQKGAQNLDQIEEATFRMDNLKVAREMEAVGKTPKEIRLATGWEKNLADQKWRYEILDGQVKDVTLNYINSSKIFENPTANIKLSELYSNEELFNTYPQLKNTEVVFYDTKNELYNGNLLFVFEDKIYINKKDYERQKLGGNLGKIYNGATLGQAITHELSHIIQTNEGFAQGSSRQFNEEKVRESISFFRNRNNRLSEREGIDGRYDKYVERTLRNSLGDEVADDILNTTNLPLELVVSSMADRLYKNFAGEVEAKNVEKRFFMSPQERLEQTLQETQDIPFEDQFVLQFKNNIQSSQRTAPQITQEIIDKLKQNGLSEDVQLLSTEEINKRLEELGVSEDVRKQVIAWHGSPYSFDKFRTASIGTGEGAQVFGWGLYFTSLEDIARRYAKELEPQFLNLEVVDKTLSDAQKLEALSNFDVTFTPENSEFYYRIYLSPENGIGIEQVENNGRVSQIRYVEEFEELYNEINDYFEETFDFNLLDIEGKYTDGFYKNGLPVQKTTKLNDKGNQNILYKVYLHKGKNPSEYTYLDNDKIVGKDTVDKVKKRLNIEGFDSISNRIENNITGEDLYEILTRVGKGKENPYKEASLFLLRAGIDGIKYPAESISRGATSDTARGFNYVVFDENAITIEEQIQFQKSLNNVGINLITNGFTVKEYPTNSKILDILIAKNVIEKVC